MAEIKNLIIKKIKELDNAAGNNVENLYFSDIKNPVTIIIPKLK